MRGLIRENTTKKAAIFLLFISLIFWISFCVGTGTEETITKINMSAFTLILWSILLEAFPFVLLGTIISSLIQVFVSENTIIRILPKNNFLRLVVASLIGLVFPVCECAIIPITRGLIKKGMPMGPAIAFMIATPIVNPIVLLSTYNAFPTMPEMMVYRAVCGFAGAILIGLLVNRVEGKAVLKNDTVSLCNCGCEHEHEHHSSCECNIDASCSQKDKKGQTLRAVLSHTNAELQSVGMYLIFGAVIAACMQMVVPTDILAGISGGTVVSILVMMLLAFVLSLCSEADAFIGSTFLLRFSGASVLAFLITGPMIDIKNMLMMMGSFKKKFVARLILTILFVCFVLAMIANYIMGGNYA